MSRIFLFPSFFLPMTISFGSFMYFLVIEAISFGMVAEKSSIFRFSGIAAKISLILSVKPMFNISSASSRMTFFTLLKSTVLRFIKSIKRPGVATTTCTPLFSVLIWLSILEPPYTGRTFRLSMYLE